LNGQTAQGSSEVPRLGHPHKLQEIGVNVNGLSKKSSMRHPHKGVDAGKKDCIRKTSSNHPLRMTPSNQKQSKATATNGKAGNCQCPEVNTQSTSKAKQPTPTTKQRGEKRK